MFNLKIMEDKAMLPTIAKRSFRPFYMPNFFDDDFFPMITQQDKFNAGSKYQGR